MTTDKITELIAVIEGLLAAIAAGEYYGHVVISPELSARIRAALEVTP